MTEPNPRLLELSHTDLALMAEGWRKQSIYWRAQALELNQWVQAQKNNTPQREQGRTITYPDKTGNTAASRAGKKRKAA